MLIHSDTPRVRERREGANSSGSCKYLLRLLSPPYSIFSGCSSIGQSFCFGCKRYPFDSDLPEFYLLMPLLLGGPVLSLTLSGYLTQWLEYFSYKEAARVQFS